MRGKEGSIKGGKGGALRGERGEVIIALREKAVALRERGGRGRLRESNE